MNRQAQAAVMFLVGAAMLHASLTGLYLRYVKAGLRPPLIAAAIVLIAAAVATVWYERRRQRAARDGEHGDGHGHPHDDGDGDGHGHADGDGDGDGHGHADGDGHGHREPRISWLLLLPLFALILVAPPALGSYSAAHTGTVLQRPWGFPALPAADGPVRLGAMDYATRAVFDKGQTLGGRRIEITGFVTLGAGGAPYLTRMVLNCCAADAQPVKIGLSGRTPPVLQPDTWIQVVGTYTAERAKDPVDGVVIPYIHVSSAEPVKAPKDPYESWTSRP